MKSTRFELERLKYSLMSKGYSERDAEEICDQASMEMSVAITDAMGNALETVSEAAIQKDAWEFIMEMKMVPRGEMFHVGTESGRTDFSLPPFPMLSHLLKNAKVAKDGSLYKVIPVGKSSSNKPGRAISIGDVQSRIQSAKDGAHQRTTDPMAGPAMFSDMATFRGVGQRKSTLSAAMAAKGTPEFRTASSKQSPSAWTLPEKDKDLTQVVDSTNNQLDNTVDDIILSIIRKYEEGY